MESWPGQKKSTIRLSVPSEQLHMTHMETALPITGLRTRELVCSHLVRRTQTKRDPGESRPWSLSAKARLLCSEAPKLFWILGLGFTLQNKKL